MKKVNLLEKFNLINEYWDPKVIGEVNNMQIKLAKIKGEFDWHFHEKEDEMFLVLKGQLEVQLPDKKEILTVGEMYIVPQGIEHRPVAKEEVLIMMIEPSGTKNTGNIKNEKTKSNLEWI